VHDKLGSRGDVYFRQLVVAVRATVGGTLVVAALDGVLLGVAYAIAKVPSAVVWGAVTGLLAMIPYLAYVAVGAIALVLWAQGAGTAAMALCGFGVAVIFASDKFIRPALTGRASHLGFLWVLLGGLGGLETFGLLGIFIGPVILASAIALWREWCGPEQDS
jgi:predicted PurR-regulated permease PerM